MTANEVETYFLRDESETEALGRQLAGKMDGSVLVFLQGELGAGKTTLVRGILRALGYDGAVKSPTYTLLEPYELADRMVFHFDLYRIGDSEELDFIGMDELLDAPAIKLIEWPERAEDRLPRPDIDIHFSFQAEGRRVEVSFN